MFTSVPVENIRRAQKAFKESAKTRKFRFIDPEYNGPLATEAGLNSKVLRAEYAVRGPLVILAEELKRKLDDGVDLPFDKIIMANIGNPQAVNQKPLTFVRQVLAGATYPLCQDILPRDAAARAKAFTDGTACKSIGAYSSSKGLPWVRNRVAKALERRDGVPANPEHIYLTDGASKAAMAVLELMIRDSKDGVLLPIPQYPLYSAAMTLLGGTQVSYYLREDEDWGLDIADLESAVAGARKNGVEVRAIVVINPGNPTGQSLSRQNIEDVIKFARKENLLIMADEVYQVNIYDDSKPFHSFKKVATELDSRVEIVSFHSTSKGVIGECGFRGGYMEILNLSKEAENGLTKLATISLCSNLSGQVALDVMMTPPVPGEESYELYQKECDENFNSMARRAAKLHEALSQFEGVTCNKAQGAMYLFPKISIPSHVVREAESRGMAADALYCEELLKQTGICLVPGSGFGQKEGTYHFRTTILPPEEEIDEVVTKLDKFHHDFLYN